MKTTISIILLLFCIKIYAQNVGIGIDVPTAKLNVNGSTKIRGDLNITNNDIGGTWLYLTNQATGWKLVSTGIGSPGGAGNLYFYDPTNSSKLTLLANGNLGVGNDNPLDKLSVNGDLKVAGTLKTGHIIVNKTGTLAPNHNGVIQCLCPTGTTLIGGGGGNASFDDVSVRGVTVSYSGPDTDPDYSSKLWTIYLANSTAFTVNTRAWAICARIGN